jgi:DNA-directed RNA polymerase subunit RPC12/RpoP
MSGFKLFTVALVIPFIIFMSVIMFVVKAMMGVSSTSNKQITCKTCGHQLLPYSQFCSHCGTKVTNKIICEYCGHENDESAMMCSECNGLLK